MELIITACDAQQVCMKSMNAVMSVRTVSTYFWPLSVSLTLTMSICVLMSSAGERCNSTWYLIHLNCFRRVAGSIHLTQTFLSTSPLSHTCTHTHFAFSSTYFHAAWDSDRDKQSGGSADKRQNCNPRSDLQLALISVYFYYLIICPFQAW